MELLLGRMKSIAIGVDKIPTASELAEADPRIIYVGGIRANRDFVFDSFLYTVEWETVRTIESATIKDGVAVLNLNQYPVDGWNPVIHELLDEHDDETYVGNVYDITPYSGRVYYDTYSKFLCCEDRFIKKDGKKISIKPALYLLKNYVDLERWRLVTRDSKGHETHYAFENRIDAIFRWLQLRKGHTVLHNIAPSVDEIQKELIENDITFNPRTCERFNASYSTEGFLNTFWEP